MVRRILTRYSSTCTLFIINSSAYQAQNTNIPGIIMPFQVYIAVSPCTKKINSRKQKSRRNEPKNTPILEMRQLQPSIQPQLKQGYLRAFLKHHCCIHTLKHLYIHSLSSIVCSSTPATYTLSPLLWLNALLLPTHEKMPLQFALISHSYHEKTTLDMPRCT